MTNHVGPRSFVSHACSRFLSEAAEADLHGDETAYTQIVAAILLLINQKGKMHKIGCVNISLNISTERPAMLCLDLQEPYRLPAELRTVMPEMAFQQAICCMPYAIRNPFAPLLDCLFTLS